MLEKAAVWRTISRRDFSHLNYTPRIVEVGVQPKHLLFPGPRNVLGGAANLLSLRRHVELCNVWPLQRAQCDRSGIFASSKR
jgi:hypothetical protein